MNYLKNKYLYLYRTRLFFSNLTSYKNRVNDNDSKVFSYFLQRKMTSSTIAVIRGSFCIGKKNSSNSIELQNQLLDGILISHQGQVFPNTLIRTSDLWGPVHLKALKCS